MQVIAVYKARSDKPVVLAPFGDHIRVHQESVQDPGLTPGVKTYAYGDDNDDDSY